MIWIDADMGNSCRLEISPVLSVSVVSDFVDRIFTVRCGGRELKEKFTDKALAKAAAERWAGKIVAAINEGFARGIE